MASRILARLRRKRPAVHVETLLACTALFMLAAGNGPFWHALLAGRPAEPGTWLFAAAVFLSLSCIYFALAAFFVNRWTVRPVLAVLLLVTAASHYFMERYAVYLDRAMLRNILATDPREAGELLSWALAGHLLLLGGLPAALLWWPTLRHRPVLRAAAVRTGWILGALVLGTASLLLVFADFAATMRNHREMRWLITPGNVVVSLVGHFGSRAPRAGQPRLAVAPDAKPGPAPARPLFVVMVVGETARAQNFSLNGYPRDTNPELARRGVVDFPQATACGTSTEVSLPCMFSPWGRRHYDEDAILSHESVLNVLARTGVHVLWRDNQSGCKGVCEGLPQEATSRLDLPGVCRDGQCLDEALLHGLDAMARDASGNTLVVLHMLGNHGPAYFKRYPPAFRRFTPACETEDLRRCDPAQILNAYDNAILYTDSVLGRLVDLLQAASATHDSAMLYVSDHGESLGENGLYLHGLPWAIAPDTQTHVPFIFWASQHFAAGRRLDMDCLRARARQPVSHDNLFHSLLGLFDVKTRAYEPGLDIFGGCRRG
ncbi:MULTISPECIES: phosphoethanolamine--lipid A transferase [Ramlibacter]|uniref:Phosphoethanolamine--lipid A transferase n=1 Tax=Ramlibacter aquaticus TaxID=2780094 RepID=A0ABR9SB89_9BURK|nr:MULTISPECIES: phosphoethanolamine--lipid A transferase [Ramlibacter]MBE7939608.1 phosphoethanolamine--lipid A transferase [Ramlibacter aquaticus]